MGCMVVDQQYIESNRKVKIMGIWQYQMSKVHHCFFQQVFGLPRCKCLHDGIQQSQFTSTT